MEKELAKTGESKPARDEHGRLLPGNTANPNGRPSAGVSITDAIKRKLNHYVKLTTGEKRTYLELLITAIFDKALKKGDTQMLKEIWHYIDGMPQQKISMSSDPLENIGEALKEIANVGKYTPSSKTIGENIIQDGQRRAVYSDRWTSADIQRDLSEIISSVSSGNNHKIRQERNGINGSVDQSGNLS